jgi:macrodomain Ter protein organizer (MatP/YcbG family)
MLICYECRRLERLYALAFKAYARHGESMMLVSRDEAQIVQAWLSRKQAGDLLDRHHQACAIRKIRHNTEHQRTRSENQQGSF